MFYNIGDMVEIKYTGLEKPMYFMVLDITEVKAGDYTRCYKCYNIESGDTSYTYLPLSKTRKVNNAS